VPTRDQSDYAGEDSTRREWGRALLFVVVVGAAAIGLVIWLAMNFLFRTCACG
jgi:hypothetical protein